MIKRFIKINDQLFRGSAPTVSDVKKIHDIYGINKVVSLDASAGLKIDRICKISNIEHITIPIDMTHIEPIIELLNYDLYDLLMNNGPTFVHCIEGKDRTGMVIAMFKCKYLNWNCHDAIKEAEDLGFGIGLPPKVVKFYKKLICESCLEKHDHINYKNSDNNTTSDIVNNERDEALDYIQNMGIKSFAPYLDGDVGYQYNNQYLEEKIINEKTNPIESNIPLVGLFNNNSGAHGFGPVEIGNGFI